jgi:GNAT superfamily N-acetyltransferase
MTAHAAGARSQLAQRDDPWVRIRRAVLADASRLAELHVRSWQAGYQGLLPQALLDGLDPAARLARWQAILLETDWPGQGTLVAEDGDELVGFARLCPERDAKVRTAGEVAAFHVAPDHWRKGVGRHLMSVALSQLSDAGFHTAILWVLSANERAIRFYEATGWRADGATKSEKADALKGITVAEMRMAHTLS